MSQATRPYAGQSDADRQQGGRSSRGLWLALLLVLACVAVLLTVLPGDESDRKDGAACTARTVGSWRAEPRPTDAFAAYGDDGARDDDWSGGDGTHSVRLPDGRVLWLFSDTFLGRVHEPPNLQGQPHKWRDGTAPMVRNSGVVMSRSGGVERTLPTPLFADPAPGQWRWPVAAKVEPRTPGGDEKVVRVLLWTRAAGPKPWIFGVPAATEVATLTLPDLALEGITQIQDQRGVADPEERVLYGTTTVDDGDHTYVFGGNDAQTASRPSSHAYVARVPHGGLGDPAAWRYWNGSRWAPDGRAKPRRILGDGDQRGVGSAFTVVREGGTYVLFTMAAGAQGLTTVTSYWACSPTGPWHGPAKGFAPPLPRDRAANGDAAAYNPQAHAALSGDGRLVLSYDVNALDATATAGGQARVNRNVELYRPRFVSLRLARPQ